MNDTTTKRGPGRPPLYANDKIMRKQVTLSLQLIEQATELGDGNLSAGLRRLWVLARLLGGGDPAIAARKLLEAAGELEASK